MQYGVATFVASWLVVAVLWSVASLPLLLPLLAGFAIVAPLLAAGLYTISAAIADGRTPGWGDTRRALSANGAQLAFMGGFLLLLHLFWMRVATLLFAIFFARADIGWQELPDLLLGSVTGLLFLLVGAAIGGAFALFSFVCTVISIPLLLDRKVDVVTATVTSWTAFRHNRPALLLWAALIAGAILFSFATFFAGLVLAMPLIGLCQLARLSRSGPSGDFAMIDIPESGARMVLGLVMLLLLVFATALLKHALDEPMRMFGWGLFVFSILYICKLLSEHCDAADAALRAQRTAVRGEAA